MDKIIYKFNSLEFLNASIDEIYHKKYHYINGKDLIDFKGAMSQYFVQIERVFRYTYFSDISLDLNKIDMNLFKQQFPFIYNKFAKANLDVNGIEYYLKLLSNLRNINLHAIIAYPIGNEFSIDGSIFYDFPILSEKLSYMKNGALTIAGMLILIMPLLDSKKLENLIDYLFLNWGELIFGTVVEKINIKRKIITELEQVFNTNYEVDIRNDKPTNSLLQDIFGKEYNNLIITTQDNTVGFVLDLSTRTKAPKFAIEGEISNNNNLYEINIKKGSNIGVYFENDYSLKTSNLNEFCNLCCKVPPFLALAYLYVYNIDNYSEKTNINYNLFLKLNKPKFYRDKSIRILSYGDKKSDIREINKVVRESLLRMFLDIEEKMIFKYGVLINNYSKCKNITKALNVSEELEMKIIACRNFVSHDGMFDEFYYIDSKTGYMLDFNFICDTFMELISFLYETHKKDDAEFIKNKLYVYLLNLIVAVKYKRIFVMSTKLFFNKFNNYNEVFERIEKSLGSVFNSFISGKEEKKLLGCVKNKFYFNIAPNILLTDDRKYSFNQLVLMEITGKDLEFCGEKINKDVIRFISSPRTKLNKITKNGKKVTLDLIKKLDYGILKIYTYVAK